jgi:hypothetical protein
LGRTVFGDIVRGKERHGGDSQEWIREREVIWVEKERAEKEK